MKAKKFFKKVQRAIHPEFKKYVSNNANSLGTYTSSIMYFEFLGQIGRGNLIYSRIGNRITMKSFKIRITIEQSSANTSRTNFYRYLILWRVNTENEGSILLSDILDLADSNVGTLWGLQAYRNTDYYKNFKVLYDSGINKLGNTGNLTPVHFKQHYFKMNKVITYDSTTEDNDGTAASVSRNQLWIVGFADQSENYPSFIFDYVLSYIDC